MSVDEILSNLGIGSDRLRTLLNEEIARLAEKGLLDSDRAEELKERFRGEVDRQTRLGVSVAKDLGVGVGSVIRELLDLPSRGELQGFFEAMDLRLRESEARGHAAGQDPGAPEETPIHDPARRPEPGRPFEVLPGVQVWSRWDEERGIFFNGARIDTGAGIVVIDPVDPGSDALRNAILELGPVDRIVITNRNHVRAAPWLAKATRARVVMHERETPAVAIEVHERVKGDAVLPGGLRVIELPGKSPGEIAILRAADGGQLFIGDALIGRPPGGLALLPEAKLDDPRQLRRSLRNLLDEDFDALLLGDGCSILADAARLAHAFLRTI